MEGGFLGGPGGADQQQDQSKHAPSFSVFQVDEGDYSRIRIVTVSNFEG